MALTPIVELDEPIAIAWRPGDDETLYIAEKGGLVFALRASAEPAEVLDLTDETESSGERGLLGLDFAADGSFAYLNYTDEGGGDSHVVEVPVAADGSLDRGGMRELLFVDQPYANHNGGSVVVGPDGLLYLGFGDGGSGGDPERRGLDLSTLLGKILRIDPRPNGDQPYTIPPDNPFVEVAGARPEIWAYGLRNPWRFSFDSANADLWIGDVGQGAREEVDWQPAQGEPSGGGGANLGWSAFEGTRRFNEDQPSEGAIAPVFEYSHDLGCSITGGYLYRGTAIPVLHGAYVFADYCDSGVRAVVIGGAATPAIPLTDEPGSIVSFGEAPDGELYVASQNGGVYRLDPA